MNWLLYELSVSVISVFKSVLCPCRRTMVTGLSVSLVEYVIAAASPSVIGFGTWVKNRTLLWAATQATNALRRTTFANISSFCCVDTRRIWWRWRASRGESKDKRV